MGNIISKMYAVNVDEDLWSDGNFTDQMAGNYTEENMECQWCAIHHIANAACFWIGVFLGNCCVQYASRPA